MGEMSWLTNYNCVVLGLETEIKCSCTHQPTEVMVFLLGLAMCCCLFFLGLYSTNVQPAG